jgi:hypothetical protein
MENSTLNWLLSIIFVVFTFFVVLSCIDSVKKEDACKLKGGIPITERGTYKLCMKADGFIEGIK